MSHLLRFRPAGHAGPAPAAFLREPADARVCPRVHAQKETEKAVSQCEGESEGDPWREAKRRRGEGGEGGEQGKGGEERGKGEPGGEGGRKLEVGARGWGKKIGLGGVREEREQRERG